MVEWNSDNENGQCLAGVLKVVKLFLLGFRKNKSGKKSSPPRKPDARGEVNNKNNWPETGQQMKRTVSVVK